MKLPAVFTNAFPKANDPGEGWEAEGTKRRDCNNHSPIHHPGFRVGVGKGQGRLCPFLSPEGAAQGSAGRSLLPHLGSVARGSPGCGEGGPAVCSAGDLFALPTASSLIA